MGTAERRSAPEDGAVTRGTALKDPEASDRGAAADVRGATDRRGRAGTAASRVRPAETASGQERAAHRPLWVEEPARRRRMPDPVRTAAVRAVLLIALTLVQAMVAFLCTLAGSWLAFPMVISSVVSTVVATWSVLDVWVTRQVWNQRNGVVSTPSSTARALRRERRRARPHPPATDRPHHRLPPHRAARQLSPP